MRNWKLRTELIFGAFLLIWSNGDLRKVSFGQTLFTSSLKEYLVKTGSHLHIYIHVKPGRSSPLLHRFKKLPRFVGICAVVPHRSCSVT